MKTGEIFTPNSIVNLMLDQVGYINGGILRRKIIDNSCGDGSFICEIIKRYIDEYILQNSSLLGVEKDLEKYICGIELQEHNYLALMKKLYSIEEKYNLKKVNWNIKKDNTLEIFNNYKNFAYVVGNPPYIRIHDMNQKSRKQIECFEYTGMIDLYIIFYYIGINMLSKNGKLIYITPNSFFTSKSAEQFRNKIIDDNIISQIINLGHFNPFKNATTYTAIMKLDASKNSSDTLYYEMGKDLKKKQIAKFMNNEFYIDNRFILGSFKEISMFKKIISNEKKIVTVKNGVATNKDSFFFKKRKKNIKNIHTAYKISTGEYGTAFFPYTIDGIIPFDNLTSTIKTELINNKEILISRDLRGNDWYGYARTQGIKDTFHKRICVNNIISNSSKIKVELIDEGVVVYSGYYICITDKKLYDIIKKELQSSAFFDYVRKLNKPKNGNYYFFSSKDLEKYINYKLKEKYL